MEVLDFANSYQFWDCPSNLGDKRKPGHMLWGNCVRIPIEARTVLTDEETSESDEFFLIAPCRTEWMYRDDVLFQIPSREYRQIWSRTRGMSVGRGITYAGEQPTSDNLDRYNTFDIVVETIQSPRELETDEAVIEATEKNLPITVQTEISDAESGMRAVIEYPVKTMNYHPERNRYQVDTGPVMWPKFLALGTHWIECLRMSHVIYNRFDKAEFIIRCPTPIEVEGKEVCEVLHYSEVHQHEAKNRIFCPST